MQSITKKVLMNSETFFILSAQSYVTSPELHDSAEPVSLVNLLRNFGVRSKRSSNVLSAWSCLIKIKILIYAKKMTYQSDQTT